MQEIEINDLEGEFSEETLDWMGYEALARSERDREMELEWEAERKNNISIDYFTYQVEESRGGLI